jgi:hypothetical protein
MAFRGQGSWADKPNVPYTHWQEPPTPKVERWSLPVVNSGARRNYDGGSRWAGDQPVSVTAQVVGGHVAKRLRDVKRKQKETARTQAEQEREKKIWSPPQGQAGKGVVPPPPKSSEGAPTAPASAEAQLSPFSFAPDPSTGVPTRFGAPAERMKPPLTRPGESYEKRRRRYMNTGSYD